MGEEFAIVVVGNYGNGNVHGPRLEMCFICIRRQEREFRGG